MNTIYISDLDPLLEKVNFKNRQVVDVGCGNADKARVLVKSGATVIGIEPDLESWQVGEIEKDGFKLIRGGAQDMAVDDNSADVVIFMYSLHHVPTELMKDALSEASRVLKDTGVLYIAEPIAKGSYQDVCEPFLDETQIRLQAMTAIDQHQGAFNHCTTFDYVVPEYFDSYTHFVDYMAGYSLNRYERSDVDTPVVKDRFEQCLSKGRYRLDQPVKVWLFYNDDENLNGVL